MLPDAVKFSSRMRRLGLGDGTRIVLYDNNKFSASARRGGCSGCSGTRTWSCWTGPGR